MTDAELDRFERHREENIRIELDQMPRCPECNSQDFTKRKWRAPGIVAPDYTCSWWECEDCGFKTDPA